jgi:hypothetical protein
MISDIECYLRGFCRLKQKEKRPDPLEPAFLDVVAGAGFALIRQPESGDRRLIHFTVEAELQHDIHYQYSDI